MTPNLTTSDGRRVAIAAIAPAYAGMLAANGEKRPDHETPRAGSVAYIPLVGAMTKYGDEYGWTASTIAFANAVRNAADDREIAAIYLSIDSPGGEVAGLEDAVEAVRYAAARKHVHAHIDDLGASAAYWVASQASAISANAYAEVGSIGAYAAVWDVSEALAKQGIKVHVVASGPEKGKGTEGLEIEDDTLAALQAQVDRVAGHFVRAVAAGRHMEEERVREMATGATYPAEDALAVGLIDAIATNREALAMALAEVRKDKYRRARVGAKKALARAGLDKALRAGAQPSATPTEGLI